MWESLIGFAASVQGVISLLALAIVAALVLTRVFFTSNRRELEEAVKTGNPEIVEKIGNRYGIKVSELKGAAAREAALEAIRSENRALLLRLVFGFLAFAGVLILVAYILTIDEEPTDDVSLLLTTLSATCEMAPEQRVEVARLVFQGRLTDGAIAVLSEESPVRCVTSVERAPAPSPAQVAEAVRASTCDTVTVSGPLIRCDGLTRLIDTGSTRPLEPPRAIVVHATVSAASAESLARFFREQGTGYHALIGRDGMITQLALLDRAVAHIGRGGAWEGLRLTNANTLSIGLDNLGILAAGPDGTFSPTPREPPVEVAGQAWEPYTERQQRALTDLIAALTAQFGDLPVVGHDALDPRRRADPGPLIRI